MKRTRQQLREAREVLYEGLAPKDLQFVMLWESVGARLAEAQLDATQIRDLFLQIEKGATDISGNRTLVGHGVDAAREVGQAWNALKTSLTSSGPIEFFDQKYDQAAAKLKAATGGDQGAMQYINAWREFSKKHPVLQGFIYSAVMATAAMATGGVVAGPAIAGVFGALDAMIKGNKLSSSVWRGAKGAAIVAGLQWLMTNWPGSDVPPQDDTRWHNAGSDLQSRQDYGTNYYGQEVPPVTQYVVQSGDTLSHIADANNISVQELIDSNPQLVQQGWDAANPNNLPAGIELNLPVETNSGTYAGGTGLQGTTDAGVSAGQMPPDYNGSNAGMSPGPTATVDVSGGSSSGMSIAGQPVVTGQPLSAQQIAVMKSAMAAGNTYPPEVMQQFYSQVGKGAAIREYIDRDLTVYTWALNESLGKARGGVHLTHKGIVEGVLGKLGDWMKTKGHNLTTKVTQDKLLTMWKKGGQPTDSTEIANLLKQNGIDAGVIVQIYRQMGLPEPFGAQQAQAQQGQQPEQGQQEQPAQPAQQQKAAAGLSAISNPNELYAAFEDYMAAGGKIPPGFRGVLKDILLTAVSTVNENKKTKMRK